MKKLTFFSSQFKHFQHLGLIILLLLIFNTTQAQTSIFTRGGTSLKGLIWRWDLNVNNNYVSRMDDYNGDLNILTDDNFYLGQISTSTGAPTGQYTFYANVVSGNVGIGTTSPGAKLQLNGNMRAVNEVRFSNGNNMKGLVWGGTDWSGYYSRIDDYEGQLRILTDDSFYLGQLNASGTPTGNYTLYANVGSGQVGIGTTSPTQKLQVEGNSYFNGTMGIGTAPVSDISLKVQGSFDVSSSSTNTIFHVSTGKGLVFVGDSAYDQYISTGGSSGTSVIQDGAFSLWVSKGIVSEDLALVDVTDWSDFVFDKDYKLRSLEEVAAYITTHGHLPEMPSEAEVKAQGYSVHDINKKLLQKIEELTLYAIQQEAKFEAQKKQFNSLEQRIKQLEDKQ